MKSRLYLVLAAIASACADDHQIKPSEAEKPALNAMPEPSAPTVAMDPERVDIPAQISGSHLHCALEQTSNESSDIACQLSGNQDASISFGLAALPASNSAEILRAGQVRIRGPENLKLALALSVEVKRGETILYSAPVGEQLSSAWTLDRVSLDESGKCIGEACVLVQLRDESRWVRASIDLHDYPAAVAACSNLVYGGYADWRLPSPQEISEAFDLNLTEAATFKSRIYSGFSGPIQYWTSVESAGEAEVIIRERDTGLASIEPRNIAENLGVICVSAALP